MQIAAVPGEIIPNVLLKKAPIGVKRACYCVVVVSSTKLLQPECIFAAAKAYVDAASFLMLSE